MVKSYYLIHGCKMPSQMHLENFSQGLLHKGEKGGGAAIQVVDENTGSIPALFTQKSLEHWSRSHWCW